jgi:hypothetical protein
MIAKTFSMLNLTKSPFFKVIVSRVNQGNAHFFQAKAIN